MTAEEIFRTYVRQIGIGGIAMAGIIGDPPLVEDHRRRLLARLRRSSTRSSATAEDAPRTQTDLRMVFNLLLILLTALLIFVFFYGGVVFNLTHAVIGLLIVVVDLLPLSPPSRQTRSPSSARTRSPA